MFGIFGAVFVFKTIGLDQILLPLSVIAMFVGSIAAIYQTNIKRLLAYSSIAQVGYMTLGISLLNMDSLTGGIVHLFNHAVMKCGLFLVVGCVVYRIGSTNISDMKGLMKRMPLTTAAFIVGGLSLIGVPGTVGFVSKWYLVLGAIKAQQYLVAGLTLLSSLLAVIYVWKVVEIMVFGKAEGELKRSLAPMSMLIPTWFLMGAAIYYGLNTEVTVGIAQRAAEAMLGAASTLSTTGGLP
jgi:multicomponent Na+:H+ antiporter subunit D